MKFKYLVVYATVGLGFAIFCTDVAHARRQAPIWKTRTHCVDQPLRFSIYKLLFGGKPQPNGCAPPVFQNGEYIGQDPDPYIRLQLYRDPDTGYTTRY